MAVAITTADVQVYAPGTSAQLVDDLIRGTLSRAAFFAPCILQSSFTGSRADAARDIIIGAIVRAIEGGSGAVTTLTAGPHSKTVDTTRPRRSRFTQAEKSELRSLCGLPPGGGFTISLAEDEGPQAQPNPQSYFQ
jgi:hypothetical protein